MMKKVLACTNREQLTSLLMQAESREELYGLAREFGITYAWVHFWSDRKLIEYLADELLIRKQNKTLRRKAGIFRRLSEVLDSKIKDIELTLSGATLAGMMIFMLVL